MNKNNKAVERFLASKEIFVPIKKNPALASKQVPNLEEAIVRSGLKDGMTISFHHHFRNGDAIVNQVMDVIAKLGIKNLRLAASSLIDVHAPLIEHIKNGVITRIETSGLRGQLADEISHGLMEEPVIFRSHGNRAYAIETGELTIDVAFLGAPSCDCRGNANGYSRDDAPITCGSMGYARVDAEYAKTTIILTNHLVPYPNTPFAISESFVDMVVEVDNIGDPQGIMSGATRYTKNPKELLIAEKTSEVIEHSGYFNEGFSMQMGTGGASLATARFIKEKMLKQGIVADFALGGITEQITQMHEEGLIRRILDVQSFDLGSAKSLKENRFHTQISASHYASPDNKGAAVNALDVVILSALEIDVNFNVNVLTGSDGILRGAIGGHPDTAYGAKCSIVVAPLNRGRIPTIVKKVQTIVTPGSTVDVVVTERGIAVNPNRPDLKEKLREAGIILTEMDELQHMAEKITGVPQEIKFTEHVAGIVLYRDGSVLDRIHSVEE